MNSSGIKRGLAVSAVSALAVVGIPALSSTASATAGDSMTVASIGPVLNAGDVGGVVVLKTKNVTAGSLKLIGSDLTSSPNTASQTVAIKGTPTLVANGTAGDSNPTDGLDEITMHVTVTTASAGDTAKFAVYEDENANNAVDAAEVRSQVSMTTSGPVAKIDVSPASQSAAQNIDSGAYTVTLQDAAGRTTQLLSTDSITVTPPATVTTTSGGSITPAEAEDGTDSFTAKGSTVGSYDIALVDSADSTVKGKATLNVTAAADLQADEIDIVTGADSWDGFGGGSLGGNTAVRVDQSSIRIDFKSDDVADRNSTVTLNVSSANVTFGGKGSTTVTTKLDANGVGSLTITPDAFTVQEGDSISISGSFAQTLDFERSAPTTIAAEQNPYFGKLKGSVDVTVTVTDQFGAPVTTGFIGAKRVAGPNAGDAQQAKAVDNTGSATFTFTDTKATNGDVDTVGFGYVKDQYTPVADANPTGSTGIKWTTDGMGADFTTKLNGLDAAATTYKASDVSVNPLADAWDNGGNDDASLEVQGGEPGAKVAVSVDNGALILEPGENELSEGSDSITATHDGSGNLVGDYELIGTTSGLATVTVSAAHRTETSQFTVAPETDRSTARNISVSGPAEVESGTSQITYTAVVTDAFGNPIANFPREFVDQALNVQVSGPAQFKDGDASTNAAGEMKLNVALDSDAVGDVTIRVEGLTSSYFATYYGVQFGAAADRLDSSSNTDDAKGLPASSNVATATTTVKAAPVVVPEDINLVLSGKDNGAKADKLKANADNNATGLIAKLFRVVNGHKKLIDSAALNQYGNHKFVEADKNGNKKTTYVVKVAASDTTNADSASKTVR